MIDPLLHAYSVWERAADALDAEIEALRTRLAAAEADIPIINQNGIGIGRAKRPTQVRAYIDERGTVWMPPTGWAYMIICHARAEAEARGAAAERARIVAWLREPQTAKDFAHDEALSEDRYIRVGLAVLVTDALAGRIERGDMGGVK